MSKHGADVWIQHNQRLEAMLSRFVRPTSSWLFVCRLCTVPYFHLKFINQHVPLLFKNYMLQSFVVIFQISQFIVVLNSIVSRRLSQNYVARLNYYHFCKCLAIIFLDQGHVILSRNTFRVFLTSLVSQEYYVVYILTKWAWSKSIARVLAETEFLMKSKSSELLKVCYRLMEQVLDFCDLMKA